MRAAVLRQGRMVVDEIDDLRPATGQVLVETIACGICGTDLHTVDHGRELSEVSREFGRPTFDFDPDLDMVMGHEFAVRVLEAGPGVEGIRPDTVMVARPFLTLPDGRRVTTGFNNTYPGGYSQQMLLDPGQADGRQAGFDQAIEAWSADADDDNPPVVFDAVGVPGIIETAMTGAPTDSEIVVVGLCMDDDTFRPIMGMFKNLTLKFVMGWTPEEFAQSLRHLAEDRIVGETLVTGQVDLDGVPGAFEALADPDEHVKILVRPNGA